MKKPYIIILDIDNCIVGDVSNISQEWIIQKDLKNMNTQKEYNFNFENDMKKGLLRPYFKDFIDCMKKKYKYVEIYLYTNSSHRWTNDIIANLIEKSSNVKINKPYFTRDDSLNLSSKKTLNETYDVIKKSLSKKYKKTIFTDEFINTNLIFIDDIDKNTTTHTNRQIVCPKYDSIVYRNIYDNLYKVYGDDLYKEEIEALFNRYGVAYYNPKSQRVENADLLYFELWKACEMRLCELRYNKNKNDDFFKVLCENIDDLTDKNIRNINKLFLKS